MDENVRITEGTFIRTSKIINLLVDSTATIRLSAMPDLENSVNIIWVFSDIGIGGNENVKADELTRSWQ